MYHWSVHERMEAKCRYFATITWSYKILFFSSGAAWSLCLCLQTYSNCMKISLCKNAEVYLHTVFLSAPSHLSRSPVSDSNMFWWTEWIKLLVVLFPARLDDDVSWTTDVSYSHFHIWRWNLKIFVIFGKGVFRPSVILKPAEQMWLQGCRYSYTTTCVFT